MYVQGCGLYDDPRGHSAVVNRALAQLLEIVSSVTTHRRKERATWFPSWDESSIGSEGRGSVGLRRQIRPSRVRLPPSAPYGPVLLGPCPDAVVRALGLLPHLVTHQMYGR